MKVKNFFKNIAAGLAIGVGAAIPGVSGAAIAMIFKVYNSIIDSINNFRKNIKGSILVLLPILIGALLAVFGCIFAFDLAFRYMMFAIICVFAGFLIGSIPGITDEIKGAEKSKKNIIICVICGFFVLIIGILSIVLGSQGFGVSQLFNDLDKNWWMYLVLIPVGMLASVALTVPGLSGSLILVVIGFYLPLVNNAKEWISQLLSGNTSNLLHLILMILSFGIGCLLGIVLISKLMGKLLVKHHDATYFGIIGFVVASVVVLFLNNDIFNYYKTWAGIDVGKQITAVLPIWAEIIIGVVLMIITAFLSYQLVKYQRKHKEE